MAGVDFTASGITDPGVLDAYSQGRCHVFALAAAEVLGEAVTGFRIMFDPFEVAVEDDEDSDNDIHDVVHVYALMGEGDDPIALDIFGTRPSSKTEDECAERYSRAIFDPVDVASEYAIVRLTIDGYPLQEIEADMMEAAKRRVEEAFPDLVAERIKGAGMKM